MPASPIKKANFLSGLASRLFLYPLFRQSRVRGYAGPALKYNANALKNPVGELLNQVGSNVIAKKGKLYEKVQKHGVEMLKEIPSKTVANMIDDVLESDGIRKDIISFADDIMKKLPNGFASLKATNPKVAAQYERAMSLRIWTNKLAQTVGKKRNIDPMKDIIPGEYIDPNIMRDFANTVNKATGIVGRRPKNITLRAPGSFRAANYNSLNDTLTLTEIDPAQAIHEFTHSKDLARSWRKYPHLASRILADATMVATPVSWMFGDEIKKAIPGKTDDKIVDFLSEYGPETFVGLRSFNYLYPEFKAHRATVNAAKSGKLWGDKSLTTQNILGQLGNISPSQAALNSIRASREDLSTYASNAILAPYVTAKVMQPFLEKESSLKSSLIGGGLGALYGGGLGALLNQEDRVKGAMYGAGLGTLGGAGLGAVLGVPPVIDAPISRVAPVRDVLAKKITVSNYGKEVKNAAIESVLDPLRASIRAVTNPHVSMRDVIFQNAAPVARDFEIPYLAKRFALSSLLPLGLIAGVHYGMSPETKQVMIDSENDEPSHVKQGVPVKDEIGNFTTSLIKDTIMEELL